MAAFDAGNIVAAMDWDFSKFGAGKGTIPEPSDIEMERFLRNYTKLMTSFSAAAIGSVSPKNGEDGEDSDKPKILSLDEAIELMKSVDITADYVSPKISEAMLELVLQITKGSPNREQIVSLPQRIRGAFYGWLLGQLTSPDFIPAAGTKPSLSLVSGE